MVAIQRPKATDYSLTALLIVQGLTIFVVVPLGASLPSAHMLLDACHLIFAVVCIGVLTRHRVVQAALLAILIVLALGPTIVGERLSARLGYDATALHAAIALSAFCFNALVSGIVARHVFGGGRVTAHRVQGAILLYLNVASMFAIAFAALEAHWPGALVSGTGTGATIPDIRGSRSAAMTYFSLTTITTTGFGDIVPVLPLARSLANIESVFGQLFPATLLSRLIALQLAHGQKDEATSRADGPDRDASRGE